MKLFFIILLASYTNLLFGQDVTIQNMAKYFELPIDEAATRLRICETKLKKKCRALGIGRWPFRNIEAIKKYLELLNREEKPDINEKNTYEIILQLYKNGDVNAANELFKTISKSRMQHYSKKKLKRERDEAYFGSCDAKVQENMFKMKRQKLSEEPVNISVLEKKLDSWWNEYNLKKELHQPSIELPTKDRAVNIFEIGESDDDLQIITDEDELA